MPCLVPSFRPARPAARSLLPPVALTVTGTLYLLYDGSLTPHVCINKLVGLALLYISELRCLVGDPFRLLLPWRLPRLPEASSRCCELRAPETLGLDLPLTVSGAGGLKKFLKVRFQAGGMSRGQTVDDHTTTIALIRQLSSGCVRHISLFRVLLIRAFNPRTKLTGQS